MAVVLFVPFAAQGGAGGALVASVVLLTLAITRPSWPRIVRGLLWLIVAVLTALVAREAVQEGGVVTGVVGTLLYAVLLYPLVFGVRIGLLPRLAHQRAGAEA